ncbi:radical SAM/SPASM domain-containing protein [Pseudobdellovibrio exovorus]|uniref:Heme biosynthesis n=1 Tax=Pseudobdellovibrio exovorus JSS TaxID=1184267 RepID=M4VA93_9BACT|nr:radical SAM protein [Pseudobdellovibrio exovorus]AGH96327.1 heme biosynthesis [Pseudobdellovibrio exovorus JSS]
MELKRFKDIIAIRKPTSVDSFDSIVAFHASNLEVAELSLEAFEAMQEISITTDEQPHLTPHPLSDAYNALNDWNEEPSSTQLRSGRITSQIKNLTINVSQICNLKCNYCSAGGDGTYGAPTLQISIEKTLPQISFFISRLPPQSTFSISFIGGEPLLYPHAIKAIYDYTVNLCLERGITSVFKIVTNGTLVSNSETISILRTMKLDLTISIDGTRDVNDLVRPSKDNNSTTDKILEGLRLLNEDRGNISLIHFSAITSKHNTDITSNYLFLMSLNPDSVDFIFDNESFDDLLLEKFITEINNVAKIAWQKGGERELRKIRTFDHYFSLLDGQQRVENHCGAGKTHLTIDAKNRLFSCVWDPNDLKTSVGQHSQIEDSAISKYSKSLIELNNCNSCWARYLCGGGCMYINNLHTGDKHNKSVSFCKKTRSLILTTLIYYKIARIEQQCSDTEGGIL